jgi:hypothetical protein
LVKKSYSGRPHAKAQRRKVKKVCRGVKRKRFKMNLFTRDSIQRVAAPIQRVAAPPFERAAPLFLAIFARFRAAFALIP